MSLKDFDLYEIEKRIYGKYMGTKKLDTLTKAVGKMSAIVIDSVGDIMDDIINVISQIETAFYGYVVTENELSLESELDDAIENTSGLIIDLYNDLDRIKTVLEVMVEHRIINNKALEEFNNFIKQINQTVDKINEELNKYDETEDIKKKIQIAHIISDKLNDLRLQLLSLGDLLNKVFMAIHWDPPPKNNDVIDEFDWQTIAMTGITIFALILATR